ncbi:MAG: GatB/YqeY domain-containing protein [Methyloceanibacter sp.]
MRETINAALKAATKVQDKRRMSTLRLISAAIKDRDIAARGLGKAEASDAELLELLAKMIKQREESEKIYTQAGRAELAQQESEEIAIIREFLPRQLSEADIQQAIGAAIAEAGASSVKDMGKVMATLKARYAGHLGPVGPYEPILATGWLEARHRLLCAG